jgi:hypothetical protein
MLDLNYVIGNDGQKLNVSANGTIIQSATITTSGFPVQITVTGDGAPSGSGWQRLQLYRDVTPIGEILHIETPGSGVNMTVSLSTIDTPVSGTYTYSVKVVGGSGISINYAEIGQLSMIVEEKIISSRLSLNWLRRDISTPNVYYGYSNNINSKDDDNTWSIKKVTTSGSVESVTWTNGDTNYISTWDNRVMSFQNPLSTASPSNTLTSTYSVLSTPDSFSSSRKTLNISWNLLAGVDIYQIIIKESGKIYNENGFQVYDNDKSAITKEIINDNNYSYKHAQLGLTYSVTILGSNVAGVISSSFNITT